MATKAGIWVDHKQAIVVLLTDAGHELKKIAFDIGQPLRPKGKSPPKSKYTPNDFVADDRLERKVASDRQDYFDDVIANIQGVDALLILGPGEAKGELSKRITTKKLRGLAVALETADKLTDRQLVAKVRQSFAASSVKKPEAPRMAAKKTAQKPAKKTAKAAAAKPVKNKKSEK